MSDRIRKVNALITKEIATIITRNISFKPDVLVTVAKTETVRDLSYATVFISVLPESEIHYVMKTLEHEHHVIQKALHKKLVMRTPPKIVFALDDTARKTDEMDRLLTDLS